MKFTITQFEMMKEAKAGGKFVYCAEEVCENAAEVKVTCPSQDHNDTAFCKEHAFVRFAEFMVGL